MEFFAVDNHSFGDFRNLSSFFGSSSLGKAFSSSDHELEEVLMRADNSIIDVGFTFGEGALSHELGIVFIVISKG